MQFVRDPNGFLEQFSHEPMRTFGDVVENMNVYQREKELKEENTEGVILSPQELP